MVRDNKWTTVVESTGGGVGRLREINISITAGLTSNSSRINKLMKSNKQADNAWPECQVQKDERKLRLGVTRTTSRNEARRKEKTFN